MLAGAVPFQGSGTAAAPAVIDAQRSCSPRDHGQLLYRQVINLHVCFHASLVDRITDDV